MKPRLRLVVLGSRLPRSLLYFCYHAGMLRKGMAVSRISSKGQITLPAAARRAVGIRVGDRVQVRVSNGEIVVTPLADFLELEAFLGKAIPDRKSVV